MKKLTKRTDSEKQSTDSKESLSENLKFYLQCGTLVLVVIFYFIWSFIGFGEEVPPPEVPKTRTQQEIINDLEVQKSEIWNKMTTEQRDVLAYIPYSKEAYDLMMKDYNPQFGDDETGGPGTYEDVVKSDKIDYLRAVTKINPKKLRVLTIKSRVGVDSFITSSNETISLAGLNVLNPEKNTYGWPNGSGIVGSKVVLETTDNPLIGYLFYSNGTILNLELVLGGTAEVGASFDQKYSDLINDPNGNNLK